MLWKNYVFREGLEVRNLWDSLYKNKKINLLYITGKGFDLRASSVLREFVLQLQGMKYEMICAELLTVDFPHYDLSKGLRDATDRNSKSIIEEFSKIGSHDNISFSIDENEMGEFSTTNHLQKGIRNIIERIKGKTDVILDVSSLPRVAYMGILTGLLSNIVTDEEECPLESQGINLQVLVGHDPELDSRILSEEPSRKLVVMPGYMAHQFTESSKDKTTVWFPILGENRIKQLEIIMDKIIPGNSEICPVLPHPTAAPKRADKILLEYRKELFEKRDIPISNIIYAHESNPFECYRQLYLAMERYTKSLNILEGAKLAVTPLSSKLITIGSTLACFDMKRESKGSNFGVTIPYSEPRSYRVDPAHLVDSKPTICSLLLTGEAYSSES